MSLDFLNDVFLLYFAFETAKRTFQVLAVLKSYFSHSVIRPSLSHVEVRPFFAGLSHL